MKALKMATVFAAGVLAGCMASGPPLVAQPPVAATSPEAGQPSEPRPRVGAPLLLDRSDLRIGTTVQFHRLATASEIHDAAQEPSLEHLVMMLPAWPGDYSALQDLAALAELPEEADVIVVLPGYPPSRAAAEAWNYVNARLRLVVVAGGPPSPGLVADLNQMRHLERVIAQMDTPSRAGFERLQRPLSFRKLVE